MTSIFLDEACLTNFLIKVARVVPRVYGRVLRGCMLKRPNETTCTTSLSEITYNGATGEGVIHGDVEGNVTLALLRRVCDGMVSTTY